MMFFSCRRVGDCTPLPRRCCCELVRSNCLTDAYGSLWQELFEAGWAEETWAAEWPGLPELGEVGPEWNLRSPLRAERERRAALVLIDALVAIWLGIGINELLAVLKSRYPILVDREEGMWFDAGGRRIAADSYAFGREQTKRTPPTFDGVLGEP